MITIPEARFTPLRGGGVLRWGLLAPGGIARDWVHALHSFTDQRVHAVASRTESRAAAFAAEFGIERSYGSYEQLVADPAIDIVYISAPHSEHLRLALLAISAGKHVLVEKPIALNAAQAREIAAAARAAGVFAMEAMWSRFLPQASVLARLLADGALGEVRTVTADFGSRFAFDPASRAFDPALGGGALLDIGVYPLWFSHFVLGAPSAVAARGSLAVTGVDEHAAVILDYAGGAQAAITTSMAVNTPQRATVSGVEARVEFNRPFFAPSGFTLYPANDSEPSVWRDVTGFRYRDGLCYQATAAAQHVADGLLESPQHSLDDSIAVLSIIDEARAQLGAA